MYLDQTILLRLERSWYMFAEMDTIEIYLRTFAHQFTMYQINSDHYRNIFCVKCVVAVWESRYSSDFLSSFSNVTYKKLLEI